MNNKIRRFSNWLYNKTHPPRHQLTPRGTYICYYIIEKYLNEENVNNYNEDYENQIGETLKRIESVKFFERFHNSDGEEPQFSPADKRLFAAQMTLAQILYFCIKENREKVLNYIKSEKMRELIRICIKKGLVF